MLKKLKQSLNAILLLCLTSGCASWDCVVDEQRWTFNSVVPLSCAVITAKNRCWAETVVDGGVDFRAAQRVFSSWTQVVWTDEMPRGSETFNGRTWDGLVLVKAISEDLAHTAYYHELGHMLKMELGDSSKDGAHLDTE
jgi:hypothetical protein